MSQLQISLLVGGIAIIALVYGLNVLRIWRVRKKIDQRFFHNYPDVLLDVPKNQVRDGRKDRLEPILTTMPPITESEDSAGEDEATEPPIPETKEPIADQETILPAGDPSEEPPFDDHDKVDESKETSDDSHQFHLFSENDHLSADSSEDESDLKESLPQADLLATDEPISDQAENIQSIPAKIGLFEPTVDFIVEITLANPHHFQSLPRFLTTRRYNVAGCTEQGHWQVLQALPDIHYLALQIGLQTVDRNGAISQQELDAFCQEVREFAEHIGGEATFPLVEHQLALAEDLDHFCAEVDVLVNIHMRLHNAIDGKTLQKTLSDWGMTLEPDGAFHYFSEEGDSLYSILGENNKLFDELYLSQTISILTMLFDVPRIKGGLTVFDKGIDMAQKLIRQFDGDLVDDNGQTLTVVGIGRIREQLSHIHHRMQERGIQPGEALAQRLFA